MRRPHSIRNARTSTSSLILSTALLVLPLLSACGGGRDSSTADRASAGQPDASPTSSSVQTDADAASNTNTDAASNTATDAASNTGTDAATATGADTDAGAGSSTTPDGAAGGDAATGNSTNTLSGSLNFVAHSSSSSLSAQTVSSHRVAPTAVPAATSATSVRCTGADGTQVAGIVASTGAFSLDVTGLSNPISCDVLGTDATQEATFIYPTSQKALDGSQLLADVLSVSGNVDLGSVPVDTTSGQASATSVTASTSSAGVFDPTGEYVVAAAPTTVPDGYIGPCPLQAPGSNSGCEGPQLGQTFYLRVLAGTSVGSADPAYAVMLWDSQSAFAACGSRLGMTFASARATAGIDLSNAGVTEGPLQWSSVLPDGKHLLANGWEIQEATSKWEVSDCVNATAADGSNLWICHDDVNDVYNIHKNSQCTDSSGNTITMGPTTPGDPSPQCTQGTDTVSLNGHSIPLNDNTCTFPNGTVCTDDGGLFTKSPSGEYVAFVSQAKTQINTVLVPQGASCGDPGFAGHEITQLQCYANAYDDEVPQVMGGAVCIRAVRTNWNATNPADFIFNAGPVQAISQFAFERADFPAPGVLHFYHQQDDFPGVQTTSNSFETCQMQQHLSVTVRQLPNTQNLDARFTQDDVLIDTSKPVCAAAAQNGNLRVGSIRGAFGFVKR